MKTTLRKQMAHTHLTLACLALALLLLTACRSMAKTVKIDADITPAPIVGEVVTLHIKTLSPKEGGEGVFALYYNEEINFLEVAPEWYEPAEDRDVASLEWRGPVTAGESIIHEFKLCVMEPGFSFVYISGGVVGKGHGENQLYITSTADSARVIPSSEYIGSWTPPPQRTPTPIPESITISPECAGENQ